MDDVNESAPSPDAEEEAQAQPEPQPERPIENLAAEMHRKYGQLQSQVAEMAASLATMARPQPPAPQFSDAEIQQAAQEGNWQAQQYLIQQTARQEALSQVQQQQRLGMVMSQVQLLTAKYPGFKDQSSPLYNSMVQVRQTLLSQGHPNDYSTVLEAMKVAIVDNPEVVADMVQRGAVTNERARQSAVSSQSMGTIAGTGRRQQGQAEKPVKLSDRELKMAKTMGSKDPAGAIKRFHERNASGRSGLSPTVAIVLREGQ